MLNDESDTYYIVYPSWANPSYSWEKLPEILADPIRSGLFEGRRSTPEYWKDLGYPLEIKPATLLSGTGGGGIIFVKEVDANRWLPMAIFSKEANLVHPNVLHSQSHPSVNHICYIEPYDSPEWSLITGKKNKLYLCGSSIEHVESDKEHLYWLLVYKKSKQRFKPLAEVPSLAQAFGITATPLDDVPPHIANETSDWVVHPQWDSAWYEVRSPSDGVGFNFAVALYVGLHLKYLGRRMGSIHLVSHLETPVNVRRKWRNH